MSGYVYAIASDDGLVKIGFTRDLSGRLSHLRANNVRKLSPLGAIRCDAEQEGVLHRILDGERVRGEWFRGPLTTRFIELLSPWPVKQRRGDDRKRETRIGSVVLPVSIMALARALGIKHTSIYSWKRIPAERLAAIEAVTGVPRRELRPDLFRTVSPTPSHGGQG